MSKTYKKKLSDNLMDECSLLTTTELDPNPKGHSTMAPWVTALQPHACDCCWRRNTKGSASTCSPSLARPETHRSNRNRGLPPARHAASGERMTARTDLVAVGLNRNPSSLRSRPCDAWITSASTGQSKRPVRS